MRGAPEESAESAGSKDETHFIFVCPLSAVGAVSLKLVMGQPQQGDTGLAARQALGVTSWPHSNALALHPESRLACAFVTCMTGPGIVQTAAQTTTTARTAIRRCSTCVRTRVDRPVPPSNNQRQSERARTASDLRFRALGTKNVPGARQIRSKPLSRQVSDLGVCKDARIVARVPKEAIGWHS